MPNEIVTSLYMQQANSDYVIIIKPPSIEYSISSKNFLYMKTLSRQECHDLINNGFSDWHSQSIRYLTQSNKFNDLIKITDENIPYRVYLARQEAERYRMPSEPDSKVIKRKSPPKIKKQGVKSNLIDLDKKEKSASDMNIYVLEESTG
jgi:hypothetical protein